MILSVSLSFSSMVTFKETIFNARLLVFLCFSESAEACADCASLLTFMASSRSFFFGLFHEFRVPFKICIVGQSDYHGERNNFQCIYSQDFDCNELPKYLFQEFRLYCWMCSATGAGAFSLFLCLSVAFVVLCVWTLCLLMCVNVVLMVVV